MSSFFEELTKKATGLLADVRQTTSGSAGDIAGETAMPSDYGKNIGQTSSFNPSYARTESPLVKNPIFTKDNFNKVSNNIYNAIPGSDLDRRFALKEVEKTSTTPITSSITSPIKKNSKEVSPTIAGEKALGLGEKQFQKIFGLSYGDVSKNWKDKGGFEGLMSNPGFTLGLAMMSSSAQGKPISESLLQNVLASGEISNAYADRIKARSKVLGPVSEDQREEVRSVLAESDIFKGSFGQKFKNFFKGKNTEALNRRALDDIYDTAYKIAQKRASPGKEVRVGRDVIEEAVRLLEKEKKLEKSDKGMLSFFFGRGVQSTAPGLAKGGPAEAGKEYIVGEEGPEMFVPEVDGNVIKNDDAKVVNMLLEHNPQLKNISRARAVKILKNRFPDYF
jgi:hypothetical protein